MRQHAVEEAKAEGVNPLDLVQYGVAARRVGSRADAKAPPPALHHSKGHGTAVGAGGLLDHVTLILDQVLPPPGDDADADITIHVVAERFSAATRHMVVAVPGFIAELHVTVPDGIEEGETFAVRFN